mgnify:CR=1 FL=1
MNYKRIILIALVSFLLFTTPILAEDNVDTGSGSTGGATAGKGYYRSGEWLYKVTIYVGLSDKAETRTNISGYKRIGDPVCIKPTSFKMPSGVIFSKYNKEDYIGGKGLSLVSSNSLALLEDKNCPPIPITHGGTLTSVKNYFGDTKTLEAIINGIAFHKGTSKENLVKDIQFTIDGVKGTQNPNDILPIKGSDGKYKNKVPWAVIYEPVAIAHLKDKTTKLAFTATEFALAQKTKLWDFKATTNGQWIAGMTHANLPNSLVLEESWFGFKNYSPLAKGARWEEGRIIAGGGWGMRWLKPNVKPKNPIGELGDWDVIDIDDYSYRTDTEVVTSFIVKATENLTPNNLGKVKFYADNHHMGTTEVTIPEGGKQLVWIKWRTPKETCTVKFRAEIENTQGLRFDKGNGRAVLADIDVKNLQEFTPPDPRAKDPNTGKVIEAPKNYKVPKVPKAKEVKSLTWGEWATYEEPYYDWEEKWENGVDKGKWVKIGSNYEYFWNPYSITISARVGIKADEKNPTRELKNSIWTIKSGYGINLDADVRITTNGNNIDLAKEGNAITYFPEFNYESHNRIADRRGSGKFEFKHNKYSTFNNRTHFTPLWFPDGEYRVFTDIVDIWSPAGMLQMRLEDFVNIKGSVLDDWKVVPR